MVTNTGWRGTAPLGSMGLVAAGALALAAGEATAQQTLARFELTPYVGYGVGGTFEDEESATKVELDEGGAFGLIFNIRESGNTQWEVVYAQQDTSADTSELTGFGPSTDLRVQYLHGGGTYEFDARGAVQPYLVATVGGTHMSPGAAGLDSDTFWSFSLGTGLRVGVSERLAARLEARMWGTLVESGSRLFCVSGVGGAACQIQIDGQVLYQVELFAGLTMRF